MTAEQAALRLGVKVETVYAYVSRGALRRRRVPGSRASLFDAGDIEALARRGRPRRTTRPSALDIVIETAITSIGDHQVRYRGLDACGLARSATFEEVAHWLWLGRPTDPAVPWEAGPAEAGLAEALLLALPDGTALRDRLRLAVVLAAAHDQPAGDLDPESVVATGRRIVATMVGAVPPVGDGRAARLVLGGGVPLRGTLAGRLWGRLSPVRATPAMVSALNAALVLLADHELAASTLAARVAASDRADPYAVVLSGLGAVAGPLHAGSTRLAHRLLDDAEGHDAATALARAFGSHGRYPGFGHALYPDGDPRARLLLGLLRSAAGGSRALAVADAVLETARRRIRTEPNVYFALAVLAKAASMPVDAGEAIFAVARTAGWLAHAIEEYADVPERFRARAVTHRTRPPAP